MKQVLPLAVVLIVVSAAVAVFVALSGGGGDPFKGKLGVVTSVAPQAYFVKRIGGDRVHVISMISPGDRPATSKPDAGRLAAMKAARLYVKVGHPVFPFESTHLDRIIGKNPDVRIIDMSKDVDIFIVDPHLWVSIEAAHKLVDKIEEALVKLDPEGKDQYEENSIQLTEELEKLNLEMFDILKDVRGMHFLVFHPAWGYFAREFGLVQHAIEEHHKEPGPQDIEDLIVEAQMLKVKTIFVQPGFDRRHVEVVRKAIDAKVVEVDPLAYDFISNMREVAKVFARELGGE